MYKQFYKFYKFLKFYKFYISFKIILKKDSWFSKHKAYIIMN